MNKYTAALIIFFLIACNKGVWITNKVYRPKKPKFSILKKPFVPNALINNTHLYLSTERFVNYDGRILIGYMGFYADGRMIIDNAWQHEMTQVMLERNSFNTASAIGYYNTEGNKLMMQYFLPGDGGHYEDWEGIIKKDTIILKQSLRMLIKKETRYDTLVLSPSYRLQQ